MTISAEEAKYNKKRNPGTPAARALAVNNSYKLINVDFPGSIVP